MQICTGGRGDRGARGPRETSDLHPSIRPHEFRPSGAGLVKRLIGIVRSQGLPILWLCVILGATLVPLATPEKPAEDAPAFFCVLCGEGGLADGILNAALFLPLGAALSVAGWRQWRALLVSALLSLG